MYANIGFWMARLDEESSYLCTLNTAFGRYRFKRLLYGVHRIVAEIFSDIPNVMLYSNDILVYGSTIEKHNMCLRQVLQRSFEQGVIYFRKK